MPTYSKTHEKEERAKMGRGLWHSIFGALFCWLPGVGLLLAISGFARQMVRMTQAYKKRLLVYTVISLVSLVLCIGVLMGEVYAYAKDPDVLSKVSLQVWQAVTGQENYPWAAGGGNDYTGMSNPGLGNFDPGLEGGMDGEPEGGVPDEHFGGEDDFEPSDGFEEDDSDDLPAGAPGGAPEAPEGDAPMTGAPEGDAPQAGAGAQATPDGGEPQETEKPALTDDELQELINSGALPGAV